MGDYVIIDDDDDDIIDDSGKWGVSPIAEKSALDDVRKGMADELSRALPEIKTLIAEGGSAEDLAKKVAGIAQFKLIKDMFSDDERLSQAAAEKILDRAHGKVASTSAPESKVTVNVINANDADEVSQLARVWAFTEELHKRKKAGTDDADSVEVSE